MEHLFLYKICNIYQAKTHPFLKKVFTVREVEYCFSYSHPAPHLAGHFALKEAVSKSLGVRKYPFAEVEIRHTKDGAPCAYHKGKKLPVSISVSHTEDVAIGIAVA
jgi:holo-[acyl-carrier protein] synthase